MRVLMRAVVLALLLLGACKKSDPPTPDQTTEVRPRPQELAHVTLKVVGMT
jgi:hypothetical protein